jgi:hypothetical protein
MQLNANLQQQYQPSNRCSNMQQVRNWETLCRVSHRFISIEW